MKRTPAPLSFSADRCSIIRQRHQHEQRHHDGGKMVFTDIAVKYTKWLHYTAPLRRNGHAGGGPAPYPARFKTNRQRQIDQAFDRPHPDNRVQLLAFTAIWILPEVWIRKNSR